jgi:uncharacterized damage-inducible protein DinB
MPLRDLATLEKEISLYPAEDSVWLSSRDIKNSAGNLCLHLGGNLPHYIGAVLGKSGYIRNRENEFSAMGISKEKLIAEIRQTKAAVTNALEKLNDGELGKTFPEEVFNAPMTTQYFLIHLTAHLCYHLGQINYHRRLL